MTLCAAAALLVAIAVRPATADDRSVCESGQAYAGAQWATEDEQIEACTRLVAVAYFNRAVIYTGKHDYDQAIVDLDLAIRLDPKFAHAYYNRGTVYGFKHDDDRAIADFDQVLKLDPKHSLTYDSRGLATSARVITTGRLPTSARRSGRHATPTLT
jgi:tetratricopeptide (TPR) repeat protein